MAAPAEQQTPYIGSKISLISKSEIRYEGILYTVDTKESTIALAQVKSFGTEDRPTDHPFPARDEVFRFIIFKASDIKDLMVCETPKPVPQLVPGLTYDPAIVSVSQQPNAPGAAAASAVSPGNRGVAPSGSSSRTGTPGAHQQQTLGSPEQQYDVRRGAGGRRSPGAQLRAMNGARQYSNSQYSRQPYGRGGQNGGAGGEPMSYRNAAMAGVRGRGGPPQQQPPRYHGGPPPHMQQQQQHPMAPGGGAGFNNRGGYRGNYHPRGMYHQRGRGGGARGGAQEKLKFDTEFDFEKANEQFQETREELSKELKTKLKVSDSGDVSESEESEEKQEHAEEGGEGGAEENNEDDPAFYDKTVSFFDNISCEALEKQDGNKMHRQDWRKERETNTETFGQAALRSYNIRRGGYHRGYGYRGYNNYRGYHGGGYRGGGGRGGGGGGYHNRPQQQHNNNNNFANVANY